MAGLGNRFDATEHDTEQREYENLPDGDYELEVTESDVKPTSTGSGTLLKLMYEVRLPEEYKGRKIFANINLENSNSQAQEIGQRELASLCRAVGISSIEDSEELHLLPFMAKVGLSKARTGKDGKTYDPQNEVKKFYFPDADTLPEPKATPKAANDNRPAATQRPAANDNRPAQTTAKTAAAAGKARPWK